MRKTFITGLKLKGFKSFNKHVNIQFGSGFNCIAGANGSGKSNVMDALCFVLGRLSTKSIRAENYGALVHENNKIRANGASVSLTLDNSSGIFGLPDKKLEVAREISKEGKSRYLINGKRATRTQILELLEMSQIRPEGHNIILQGDISSFITMRAVDKRKLIEDIAGIGVYERKKDGAMKNLNKVEEKLREVQIVMNEKKSYLNSLEGDRKVAEQYNSYNSELKSAKSTELNLKHTFASTRKQQISSKLEIVEKKQSEYKDKLAEMNDKVDALQTKIVIVEKQIEKKGGEDQLVLQKDIENLKVDFGNAKNLVTSSENEIRRVEDRKGNLSKSLADIKGKINMSEDDLKGQRLELRKLDGKENELKKSLGLSNISVSDIQKELDEKETELDNFKNTELELKSENSKLSGELEVFKIKAATLGDKITEAVNVERMLDGTKGKKDKYRDVLMEINSMTDRDAEIFVEIKERRKEMLDKESSLSKIQMEMNSSYELLMRDKAIGAILKRKEKFGGIYGTVAELGQVEPEYSTALKVAAGARLKNIVVKDEKVAIRCLKFLREKRLGVATFLPMTKIKTSTQSHVPQGSGVVGRAADLVDCKPEFKKVFSNILRNTIVVKDTDTARSVGIGSYSMVSLEGDIFSVGGAISGGFRRETGIGFGRKTDSGELDNKIVDLDKVKSKVKALEKERDGIDRELIGLRKMKTELESGMGNLAAPAQSSAELKARQKDLLNGLKTRELRLREIAKVSEKLKDKIQKLTIERNGMKSNLKELQFGSKKKELDRIDSNKRNIEAKVATINATLENALLPERDNIDRVISGLLKEKLEFADQIQKLKIDLGKFKTQLVVKEKEEKEFYGQLKRLFSDKGKLAELLKKEQERVKSVELKSVADNEGLNALSIARAKIDSELSAVREELEEYKGIKTLPYLKNVQAAKQKQSDMNRKLRNLGNVNLKALEIYEDVKREWDKLNWRIGKLDSERQSIVNIINTIESKKKVSFMDAFNSIADNFSKIYTNLNNNVITGNLILENPESPFDGGIMIKVVKPGSNALAALSGGEQAMVGLSFLFAIAEHNPTPFYLLDEIDASLDSVNIERMAELLKEYSSKSQIIIVSHKDSVMSTADILHGIWMNKKHGESYISSMKVKR
jgi:chromosome segregation protein